MAKKQRYSPTKYFRVYRKGEYPKPKRHMYKALFFKRRQAYRFAYNRHRDGDEGLVIIHPSGTEEPVLFDNSMQTDQEFWLWYANLNRK